MREVQRRNVLASLTQQRQHVIQEPIPLGRVHQLETVGQVEGREVGAGFHNVVEDVRREDVVPGEANVRALAKVNPPLVGKLFYLPTPKHVVRLDFKHLEVLAVLDNVHELLLAKQPAHELNLGQILAVLNEELLRVVVVEESGGENHGREVARALDEHVDGHGERRHVALAKVQDPLLGEAAVLHRVQEALARQRHRLLATPKTWGHRNFIFSLVPQT